ALQGKRPIQNCITTLKELVFMCTQQRKLTIIILAVTAIGVVALTPGTFASSGDDTLNEQLSAVLRQHGFTGRVGLSLEQRLGRKIDNQLAALGRLAFHDSLLGLNDDNSCAGCHAAPLGFGDSQSIAIGVENNNIVGPDRVGPRNQRRAPIVLNNVFFPALMWNSRFNSVSGNPFDNSAGFQFPLPEGFSLSALPHLLTAQAFIPTTEKPEMTGFHPSVPGTNDGIRAAVVDRLNANGEYRKLFGQNFPEVKSGAPVTYEMLARAIAEFEFTLVFANAPIDKFARGQKNAMTDDEKRGALIFFGSGNCVSCHAVSGQSNEMFSDFRQHVAGIPQIAPAVGNVTFDGPGANEDFGLEQVTGNPNDRYAFRTSPLRNLALQPTFFHNGCFTRLEDAVRYHLDAIGSAPSYNPVAAGLDADLQGPQGPMAPVLARIAPALATPVTLSSDEFRQLIAFLRTGLLDPKANAHDLRRLIPARVPSGRPVHDFQ
ncbi:MAG TPA: cytochrome c peroxidase, partial [Pyrinomonadaceae bacterium]|nr:cytochrome c peroxidase [Pyrinomonadaceae bacterium]